MSSYITSSAQMTVWIKHHCSDVLRLWQGQLLLGLVEGKLVVA